VGQPRQNQTQEDDMGPSPDSGQGTPDHEDVALEQKPTTRLPKGGHEELEDKDGGVEIFLPFFKRPFRVRGWFRKHTHRQGQKRSPRHRRFTLRDSIVYILSPALQFVSSVCDVLQQWPKGGPKS
jgi:hypothetical protein